MKNFDALDTILNKQMEVHKKLFELETLKTQILLKGTTEQLDDLLNLEQSCIMNSSNLEKRRQNLQSQMGMSELTLKQIIVNNPEAKFLEQNSNLLTDLLNKLKKVSNINNKILNSRLEMLNFVLTNTGVTNEQVRTYSNIK
jgi:hypothetical protein